MIFIDIKKNLHGNVKDMVLEIKENINKNEFLAITGESGSGKSTFLRILAGLERADGKIEVDNKIWLDKKKFLPPQKREIGFVFQDYALFPNMNVLENLLFVKKDKKFALELLEMVGMSQFINRYPNTLSGGQKQRVAICRALMRKPKILLLDEPFSALDFKTKVKLVEDVKKLHKKFNLTTILVTHSFYEIKKLANRLIEINNGKVVKKLNLNNVSQTAEILEINGKILKIKIDNKVKYAINLNNENYKIGDKIKISKKQFFLVEGKI